MFDERIRLRHLRTFLEVARQRSVGRAAGILNVSQPAVTKTVRELESLLGVSLFDRDGRGMRITPRGEVFLRHAAVAVASIRSGVELLAGGRDGPPIRIGALPTVSARIMPGAMALFLAENSAASTKIVTGENAVLLDQLRSGDLELVVGRLAAPEMMVGFFFEHLYSEKVVFAVRKDHPLLSATTRLLAGIGGFPALMPTRNSVIRPFVERYFIANGVSLPGTQVETVSDGFGRAFVRSSDAVWIISEGVVANDVADGLLALLPLDTEETRGPVGLTMRTETVITASFESLLGSIRAVANAG